MSSGGALAGSLAVATDAAHLLTDWFAFMISLFALYISERPATKRLSYGYHRAGMTIFLLSFTYKDGENFLQMTQ